MLLECKLGELLDARTPNQDSDEEGGSCCAQGAGPKGGR
jgi:hypothetical protein